MHWVLYYGESVLITWMGYWSYHECAEGNWFFGLISDPDYFYARLFGFEISVVLDS